MRCLVCVALALVGNARCDQLSIPGRWPTDLVSTHDGKAVVVVGGKAMGGGGHLDLVDVQTFQIVKTAPLPEAQAASSITVVPSIDSPRGVAIIAMDTQSLGLPQSIYKVSLDDAAFGKMSWKWTVPSAYGDMFDFSNAAIGKDAPGKHVYVASGSSEKLGEQYYNRWWLHTVDVTGSEPTLVQTVELPSYHAKSSYEGFGLHPSPDGHVLVNSNMAGTPESPVVLVENAGSASHTVRNITCGKFGEEHRDVGWVSVLGWDASGGSFYADVDIWTSDRKHLEKFHMRHDLNRVVTATSAKDQKNYHYGKASVAGEGGKVFYPSYSGYGPLTGRVTAIDSTSLQDSWWYTHSSTGYWAKAVTIVGSDLWVAWHNVEESTLNRYSAASRSNSTLLI